MKPSESRLDIHTKKGQEALANELWVMRVLNGMRLNFRLIGTDKDTASKIDGFIVKTDADGDEVLAGIYEAKTRNMTLKQLATYGNTWLITTSKVHAARIMSERLKVPFYGFLHLVPENLVLIVKITDNRGKYIVQITEKKTKTQRTVNGGEKVRLNSFIDVTGAKAIRLPDRGTGDPLA